MSGIAGIFNLDGRPVDPQLLARMTNVIAQRGPDGVGHWTDGPVGLGHRMLHTTPESLHERQPLTDESGQLCLTLDGRVDNREELRAALLSEGIRLRDHTDAELVLQAYKCWGVDSPARIVGDFAYVIWDKGSRSFFCARDCAGVRPFVYYLSDRLFVCASEINSLLQTPGVPCEVNELRVAEFLISYLEGSDKTITFYKNIYRLPPACTLIITPEKHILRPYWALDPYREIKYRSDGEYIEAFQEVFTEAVRCRLRTNGPVASMLSGGLDSSAIVGIARKVLAEEDRNRRLVVISGISKDEDQCVEAPYINAILAQGGLEAHKIYPEDAHFFANDFEQVVKQTDDPFILYSASVPWLASCVARRKGIRVLFSGVDGDLVTSSNNHLLIELLRSGRLIAFGKEARARAKYYRPYYLLQGNPRLQALWEFIVRPLISAYVLSPHTKLYQRVTWSADRQWNKLLKAAPINGAFAQRVGVKGRLEVQDLLVSLRALSARKIQCCSLQSPFLVAAVERYDRLAASQSVELRHPLLDRRLMEFCVALPSEQKWGQGWTKLILRRALIGILPEKVCWRGYSSTNLLEKFAFELFASLGKHLANCAAQHWRLIAEYANLSRLELAFEHYRENALASEQWALWQAVFLTIWLQRTQSQN